MGDLFGEVSLQGEPALVEVVARGDAATALRHIENLPFDVAHEVALRAGFSVAGSRRDKRAFYEFLGPQLVAACKAKSLPATVIASGITPAAALQLLGQL